MKRPLILVTNDDGINAPGIRALISVIKDIGDIIVVAPDSPQSGMGHAITINSTLHSSRITPKNSEIIEYSCSGTPADCVKLAINELMPRKPDLCVSGINHGSNSSINVIYSGTMSAAIEAGIEGVPAIGFSLLDYTWSTSAGIFGLTSHWATSSSGWSKGKSAPPLCRIKSIQSISRMPRVILAWPMPCSTTFLKSYL